VRAPGLEVGPPWLERGRLEMRSSLPLAPCVKARPAFKVGGRLADTVKDGDRPSVERVDPHRVSRSAGPVRLPDHSLIRRAEIVSLRSFFSEAGRLPSGLRLADPLAA